MRRTRQLMQFENVFGSFSFRSVFLYFVTHAFFCSPVRGDSPRVTGPLQPIKALIGDNIILPCFLVPPRDVEDMALEWSRPDYKQDPGDLLNRKYVHLQRDHREIYAMKNPSYYGRTSLFKDALKDGNISLKLTNITLSDEGRYRCFIPRLRSQHKDIIIHLLVITSPTPESPRDALQTMEPDVSKKTSVEGDFSTVALPVHIVGGLVLLLLLAGIGGYVIKSKLGGKPDSPGTSYTEEKMLSIRTENPPQVSQPTHF